ncbi:hypothetical protein CL634_08360 [bacterium]|nr:hypothetical protein [bacterium]
MANRIFEISPKTYYFELEGNVWVIPKTIVSKISIPIVGLSTMHLEGRLVTCNWVEPWDPKEIRKTEDELRKNFKQL